MNKSVLSAVPILLSYYRFYNEIKNKIEKNKKEDDDDY